MKKKIFTFSLIACLIGNSDLLNAQNTFPASGSAGIGTTAPNASSILEIKSTSKGVLLPKMNKSQRDLIASPASGLLIYQTDNTKGFYYYNGTAWTSVTDTKVRGLGNNLFIGSTAGSANTTGIGNIGLGKAALHGNADRIENIAIGDSSQYEVGVGTIGNQAWYNVSVGSKSQRYSTTGTKNTSVGAYSLYNGIAANDNVAIGYNAMFSNVFSHFNVAVGENALLNSTSGDNTACGYNAGSFVTQSSECTFIGSRSNQSGAGPFINATALGAYSEVTGNSMVRLGNSSVTSIGGFANFTNVSDGRFKKEIKENVPGLEFINKLKPVTYHLDVRGLRTFLHESRNDESPEAKARIEKGIVDKEHILYSGFVAQDVEHAAQETGYDFSGVDKPGNDGSLYGLRYAEFTVPLVKAVQELDKKNAILENEIEKLKSLLTSDQKQQFNEEVKPTVKSSLEQNNPNPFSEKTTINYSISTDANSAAIIIRSLNGVEIKRINLEITSKGIINIEGRQLAQGTYTYTLEVNGRSVDTKLMVITK